MTARRAATLALLVALAVAGVAWWRHAATPRSAQPIATSAPRAIVGTLRAEPATFNRISGNAYPTDVVAHLTQARLVRINRTTRTLEPWLADRWTRSDDGRRYELHLRDGLTFSDGHPFTAADVAFSFRAVYDRATASPIADALTVAGKPLAVRVLDPSTVEITFPAPYGPGLRLLDNLPIYPAHLLSASLDQGTFGKAWGPTTPPAEMAGLGPFVLDAYEPGQRLVFARNPRYWRFDPQGSRLPHLDRITLEIVPDQNAELLRLQAGQVDMTQSELRPEDYLPMKAQADAGRVRLVDVGRSLDAPMLWFNLRPRADPRDWLRRDELRLAISHAIDRAEFARAVYLGAAEPAWGPVVPANAEWYDPDVPRDPFDPARASALLASIGLRDRNGDHVLEDATGAPARFTLLVQKGVTASEKGAAVLRERCAAIGLTVDVVALDLGAMMGHWRDGDYDAIYHLLSATDTDPAGNLDFWLSSGGTHVWNPAQSRPATAWEAQVDDLMQRQVSALDPQERRQLFSEVQRVLAAHAPVLTFAAPHVYVATSARVTAGATAVQRPQLLWSADTLSIGATAGAP